MQGLRDVYATLKAETSCCGLAKTECIHRPFTATRLVRIFTAGIKVPVRQRGPALGMGMAMRGVRSWSSRRRSTRPRASWNCSFRMVISPAPRCCVCRAGVSPLRVPVVTLDGYFDEQTHIAAIKTLKARSSMFSRERSGSAPRPSADRRRVRGKTPGPGRRRRGVRLSGRARLSRQLHQRRTFCRSSASTSPCISAGAARARIA